MSAAGLVSASGAALKKSDCPVRMVVSTYADSSLAADSSFNTGSFRAAWARGAAWEIDGKTVAAYADTGVLQFRQVLSSLPNK